MDKKKPSNKSLAGLQTKETLMASTKHKEKQLGSVATFWNEGKGDPGTSLASDGKNHRTPNVFRLNVLKERNNILETPNIKPKGK